MQVGDEVVCVSKSMACIKFGRAYTIKEVYQSWVGETAFYLEEVIPGYHSYNFRSLEEMQNENFATITKMG